MFTDEKMYTAVRSGFVEDDDGSLVEITAGKTGVAAEFLSRIGSKAAMKYFDPAVTSKRFGGGRSEIRVCGPDGKLRSAELSDWQKRRHAG
jgi:hypothetical protein